MSCVAFGRASGELRHSRSYTCVACYTNVPLTNPARVLQYRQHLEEARHAYCNPWICRDNVPVPRCLNVRVHTPPLAIDARRADDAL
jgi:hypothetical protein